MHFSGEDPIGHRIYLVDTAPPGPNQSPPLDASIVGIVPNGRQRDFQKPDPDPIVYVPNDSRVVAYVDRAEHSSIRPTSGRTRWRTSRSPT
jgi:hypothetical protein